MAIVYLGMAVVLFVLSFLISNDGDFWFQLQVLGVLWLIAAGAWREKGGK